MWLIGNFGARAKEVLKLRRASGRKAVKTSLWTAVGGAILLACSTAKASKQSGGWRIRS